MRKCCFVVAVLLACILIQPSLHAQEKMAKKGTSRAGENKAVCRKIIEFFNANNWDSVANYITEDYIEHDPDPGQKPGLKGLKDQFQIYYAAFPDMKITIKNISVEGDIVMTRSEVTGTQKGEYMGSPASGKQFDVEEFDMMRVKDGKGVEHWGVFDGVKMMMQLGMMPQPAGMDKK